VACDRLGTVAGSAAVLLALALAPGSAPRVLLAVVAVGAAAALALSPRFFRGYVGALAQSLRTGVPVLEARAVVEPTTLLTMASLHLEPPSDARSEAPTPVSADPLVQAISDLRSGDPERVRRVAGVRDPDPALVPHLVPLLARDGLFETVAPVVRRLARRCTGQLVDTLLDPEAEAVVRRRVARILKGVPTQRAAEGLLAGLGDARFDIRYRCGQALARVCAQGAVVAVPGEVVVAAAAREAARAGDSARHLQHVFTLLSIVLDREALDIAHRALLATDERLRGTALEYLDNVLPPAVRGTLWPHLGASAPAQTGRSREDIRDDLLRSAASVTPARPPR
jgi:AAA family ATP:ADP antiporter